MCYLGTLCLITKPRFSVACAALAGGSYLLASTGLTIVRCLDDLPALLGHLVLGSLLMLAVLLLIMVGSMRSAAYNAAV